MNRWSIGMLGIAVAVGTGCRKSEFSCGDVVPTVESVVVSNPGLIDGVAALEFDIEVLDSDGDLHVIDTSSWWDQTVDGQVNTSRASLDVPVYIGDEGFQCGIPRAGAHLFLPIDDSTGLQPNTEYEFAIVVYDQFGHASEMQIVSAWTPNADGTDGGPL